MRARTTPTLWMALCALLAGAAPAVAQTGFQWVRSATGAIIPGGAYVGGQEDGTPLLICRAPYLSGVYPGKMVKGNCNISYGGQEIYLHDYDILVGQGGQWAPAQPGMAGAFIAGFENGGPLYLCQATYRGGLHPGKIYDGKCDISFGGREIPIRAFNVFYLGSPTVITVGGAPYPATLVYHTETHTTVNHYYLPPPPPPRPAYDQAAADRAAAQQAAYQRQLDQQKADYQRKLQAQQQAADKAAADAEAARVRAEGEAEENRQALKAQAQAEEERKAEEAKQEQIRKGEEEENRMAAEAAAKAQAEETRKAEEARQEEIRKGEEEENRMAAEAAAKAQAEEEAKKADEARQEEIKKGEEEENRMAAEAAAKAEAESKSSSDAPKDDPPQ